LEWFADVFSCFHTSIDAAPPSPSVTSVTDLFSQDFSQFSSVTGENEVTDKNDGKPFDNNEVTEVTDRKGGPGESAGVGANGQGARPASERVRRVTAWGVSFGVVGPARPGATCLYCQSAEPDEVGGVVIVEGHGRLHEACAPAWITHQDKSK
jgi:hypothetical protein